MTVGVPSAEYAITARFSICFGSTSGSVGAANAAAMIAKTTKI